MCSSDLLIETLSLSPTWSNLVNKTTPLHLVDPKTDPQTELAEIILKDLTCVVTYVNDQKEIVNILLFNLAHFEEYLDNALIHEIEHVVTNLIGKKEDNEPGRSGFEIFYGDDSFRRYEQINEIINELEAQETTTMLHQKGIYILNNKENARITGGTNYERSRFLVNDFFKEYKPIIRASRIHTDINIMYEEVGKENFEALVDLVNDFVVTFSGGIFYKVMDDLDNDKTSNAGYDYNGYTLLGKIEIPKIGFRSVIIKDNTYRAMDLGVVLSYGVIPNERGGTVLSGHNYRGQSIFMYNIKNLESGDAIYLTDSSGRQIEYIVYEKIRYYDPTNTEIYRKFDGYHLVLSTCENDGNTRIVVKANAN